MESHRAASRPLCHLCVALGSQTHAVTGPPSTVPSQDQDQPGSPAPPQACLVAPEWLPSTRPDSESRMPLGGRGSVPGRGAACAEALCPPPTLQDTHHPARTTHYGSLPPKSQHGRAQDENPVVHFFKNIVSAAPTPATGLGEERWWGAPSRGGQGCPHPAGGHPHRSSPPPVSLQVTPRTPPPSQGKVRRPLVWISSSRYSRVSQTYQRRRRTHGSLLPPD